MRTYDVFQVIGQGMVTSLRQGGVPDVLVDTWENYWAVTVLDHAESGLSAEALALNVMENLAFGKDLSRVYGHD